MPTRTHEPQGALHGEAVQARAEHRRILHRERRWLFWGGTVLLGLVLLLAMVAAPLTASLGLPPSWIAVIVPAAEILLVVVGFGWLARLVMRRRRTGAGRPF